MTLIEFFALFKEVAMAMKALRKAIESAQSHEDVELLASCVKSAYSVLSNARCPDASTHDTAETARLVAEGNWLASTVRMPE
jgi:hypothetical protein